MLPVYAKLFNFILRTGMVPNKWSEGITIPIYINKADQNDPNSYRSITLLASETK